jgi:molybdopterin-guanine dinucleotide biosynthesis protein A
VEFMNVRDERGCPEYRWFWNVNSPEDLERVEGVLRLAR